jgi:putative thioredoxin
MSAHQSPFITTVGQADFQTAVLEASFQQPVLVDFWADWCQPCRVLMPILGKLADEYQGRFILAKVNTEEEQALAASQGIRSLPTVRLYVRGRPVDEFMGAIPEQQIRAFLDKHITDEVALFLQQVEELQAQGEEARALEALTQASGQLPHDARLKLALVKAHLAQGNTESVQQLLADMDAEDPEVAAIKSRIELQDRLAGLPSLESLQARLSANPKDSEARHQLAMRALGEQDYPKAMDELLELMRQDAAYQDGIARKTLLDTFAMLTDQPELVAQYRRKMFNLLH